MPSPVFNFTQGTVTIWKVGDTLTPQEGPVGVSCILNFSQYATFVINGVSLFGAANPLSAFSGCQSIYVDTSMTDSPVIISVAGSQQTLVIKGRTQGYYPLIAPNIFNLTATCADTVNAVNVQIILMNFFVPPAQWSATLP
jgi:hypothetical protein